MPINPNEELTPETSQEAFTVRTYDPMQPVPEEAETNMEAYIKYLYDKTQRLPEKPDTREEYFMMIAGQNIEPGSDVEPLTVTANGTYAEAGKAYSPVQVAVPLGTKSITANGTYDATDDSLKGYSSVSVDVPLPENAYLLKDITNTPTAIAIFSDGANLPMPSLKIGIEPVQSGSGDPSPTNVRPISGWDEVDVTVADDDTDPTISNVYTIDLDGTRYGGTLDVVNGVLTVDRAIVDMGDLYWNYGDSSKVFTASVSGIKRGAYTDENLISSIYPVTPLKYSQFEYGLRYDSPTSIGVKNPLYTDATTFKSGMSGVQLVYELATPLTIQLTPTAVKSLLGTNNIWADTGDILDGEYWSKTL